MTLDPLYTFERFVVSADNAMLVEVARSVARSPGATHNPLVIQGASGLGATHLLHAIGNEIHAEDVDRKAIYVTTEQWVRDCHAARDRSRLETFRQMYSRADALLIDDIQFFAACVATEKECLSMLDGLVGHGSAIVISIDRPGSELRTMNRQIKGLMARGTTLVLSPPDADTRRAILHNKAEDLGVRLEGDAADLVAQHIRTDVRSLEGVLLRLARHRTTEDGRITLDIAAACLKDLGFFNDRSIPIRDILLVVAAQGGTTVSGLLRPFRTSRIVIYRELAMCVARQLTEHSYQDIGEAFETDAHTVRRAVLRAEKIIASNADVREEFGRLCCALKRPCRMVSDVPGAQAIARPRRGRSVDR